MKKINNNKNYLKNKIKELNTIDSINKVDFKKNSKKKSIELIDEHEVIFEHVDLTDPTHPTIQLFVQFHGIKYDSMYQPEKIKFILNEAIEKYLNYGKLEKVDVVDFAKFIYKTFKIKIVIESIDLKLIRQENKELTM